MANGATDHGSSPVVLHVTESFGAGVSVAVGQYMRNYGGRSDLLARIRTGEQAWRNDELSSLGRIRVVTSVAALAKEWTASRNLPYDIVHAHSSIAGALCRALPPKCPVVYSPHALAFQGRKKFSPRQAARALEYLLAKRTSGAGAVSRDEEKCLVELGIDQEKIVNLPHDMSDTLRVGRLRSITSPRLSIVGIGRIGFQKDPELFSTIASRYQSSPAVNFTWLGGGDPKLTAQLQASGVRVSGWMHREAMLSVLAENDVLLHTARYEGMPLACVEAMSLGLPVIARDLPSYRDIPAIKRFTTADEAVSCIDRLHGAENYSAASANSLRHASSLTAEAQRNALRRLYRTALAYS